MENKRFCDLVVGDNICLGYGLKSIVSIVEKIESNIDKDLKITCDNSIYFIKKDEAKKDFLNYLQLESSDVFIATSMDKLLLETMGD